MRLEILRWAGHLTGMEGGRGTIRILTGKSTHRVMIANDHIRMGSNSYEKVQTFKYVGSLVTNKNSIQEGKKCRLEAGNSCYYSVQTLFF